MQMVTFTKARGSMIKLRVRALILMQMALTTKASGLMTSSMAMVLKAGPMARGMKETTSKVKKKAKGV